MGFNSFRIFLSEIIILFFNANLPSFLTIFIYQISFSESSKKQSNMSNSDSDLERGVYAIDKIDVDSLNEWLTGNMVNFAINYLVDQICGQDKSKRTFVIVNANQCQKIKSDENDELQTLLHKIGLDPTKWAIFIYNDGEPDEVNSGTHWSLILFDPNQRQFSLIDPAGTKGVGKKVKEFTAKIQNYFKMPTNEIRTFFNPLIGPQGDCGIYIIEYARVIIRTIVANNQANPERDFDFLHTESKYIKDGKFSAIRAREYWQRVVEEETNRGT